VWVVLALTFGLIEGWVTSTTHPPTVLKALGLLWGILTFLVALLVLANVARAVAERRSQGGTVMAGLRASPFGTAVSALVAAIAVVLVAQLLAAVL
jgi:hypothetical protein